MKSAGSKTFKKNGSTPVSSGVSNSPHRDAEIDEPLTLDGRTLLVRDFDGPATAYQCSTEPIGGGWAIETHLIRQNGRWVVGELRFFAESAQSVRAGRGERSHGGESSGAFGVPAGLEHVPQGGLTARHLRSVSFGRLEGLRAIKELDLACLRISKARQRRRFAEARIQRLTATIEARRGRGAKPVLLRLALVAQAYVAAYQSGFGSENRTVARDLGLKPEQVRDFVSRARRTGLLTASRKQGAAGGELTPRALRILEESGGPSRL